MTLESPPCREQNKCGGRLIMELSNCSWRSASLEVDLSSVDLSVRRRPLMSGPNPSSPTFCRRLCLLGVRTRSTKQDESVSSARKIVNWLDLTLTLIFSLADVSKNSTPSWSPSCLPRSKEITRSSSISHLLPTNITSGRKETLSWWKPR